MNKRLLPFWLVGMFSGGMGEGKIVVPSHKIKRLKQHTEPSKQKLNRKKGKKLRANRGKNRGKNE